MHICTPCGCRPLSAIPNTDLVYCIVLLLVPLAPLRVSVVYIIQDMSSTTFYCDCDRYCNGERKQVSRATFYFHKRKRDPIARFSATMQSFLKDKPVIESTSLSNAGTSRKSRKQNVSVTTHPASSAQDQTSAHPGQAGNHNAQVSVSLLLPPFLSLILSLLSSMAISPIMTVILGKQAITAWRIH